MLKRVLKYSWVIALFGIFLFSACNEESTDLLTEMTIIENFVDESLYRLQGDGNLGRFGCYELVFPATIEFPHSWTATVDSYDDLIYSLQEWKESNPDATERPSFVFPIEVLSQDGEVISVDSEEELKELKQECEVNYFGKHRSEGHNENCTPCFEMAFPITVLFPDDTTAEAASRDELKDLVREWKADNPDTTKRPKIVFPVEVEMEDGTIVTLYNKEELKELWESCN